MSAAVCVAADVYKFCRNEAALTIKHRFWRQICSIETCIYHFVDNYSFSAHLNAIHAAMLVAQVLSKGVINISRRQKYGFWSSPRTQPCPAQTEARRAYDIGLINFFSHHHVSFHNPVGDAATVARQVKSRQQISQSQSPVRIPGTGSAGTLGEPNLDPNFSNQAIPTMGKRDKKNLFLIKNQNRDDVPRVQVGTSVV